MSLYTSNWNFLGDQPFRKIELYPNMIWKDEYQIDLNDYIVAAADFAGPIALRKCPPFKLANDHDVHLFTASGRRFKTLLGMSKNTIFLDWTQNQDLIRVTKNGSVTVYDWSGDVKSDCSLESDLKDSQVSQVQKFDWKHGTGIVIMSTNYKFYLIINVNDPKIRKLPSIPGVNVSNPSCWIVLPPDPRTQATETFVLVSKDQNLYLLSSRDESVATLVVDGISGITNVSKATYSSLTHNLGLLTSNDLLWIGTFENKTLNRTSFDFSCKPGVSQLEFAGPGAIVTLTDDSLLTFISICGQNNFFEFMINDNMSSLSDPRLLSSSSVKLVPEIDGLRIISNTSHEFVQHIPKVIVDIFSYGKLSPGNLLFQASKEFIKSSPRADDNIRILRDKNEMDQAVQMCIEAAGHEFSPPDQKSLLRAASLGRCFLAQVANRDQFKNACQNLRVLNTIRTPAVGIPLSQVQFEVLSRNVLLDRLILRRDYELAMRMASYLKLPEEIGTLRILGNWASKKVLEQINDDDLARVIHSRIGDTSSISYADIASEALKRGRPNLALKLVTFELKPSKQVPLLLSLGEKQKAIDKAIDSGDTHLIYSVIYRLRQTLTSRDFTMMIRNFPAAYNLYQKMCKEEDLDKLRDIYYQEDDSNSEAGIWIVQAYKSTSREQRIHCLTSAANAYEKAGNKFMKDSTNEEIKLLRTQIKLESKSHIFCFGMSVQETLKQLMMSKHDSDSLSDAFRKEFNVPDERYAMLKVTILAGNQEWILLEKFSNKKPRKFGYEPFVDVCLEAGNRFEAMKYARKVSEENRVKYLVKVGLVQEAAEWAFNERDAQGFMYAYSQSGPTLRSKLDEMRSKLRS